MTTEQRILQAALRLFREKGFHGVGVAAIGPAAGISGPGIYKHFASKDQILAALFEQATARLQLHIAPPAEDPWQDLDSLVAAMVAFAVQEREYVLVYVREQRFLVEPWASTVRRHIGEHLSRWEQTVARCRPDLARADHQSMAWALNEMLLSIASWSREARENPRLLPVMRGLARDGVRQIEAAESEAGHHRRVAVGGQPGGL